MNDIWNTGESNNGPSYECFMGLNTSQNINSIMVMKWHCLIEWIYVSLWKNHSKIYISNFLFLMGKNAKTLIKLDFDQPMFTQQLFPVQNTQHSTFSLALYLSLEIKNISQNVWQQIDFSFFDLLIAHCCLKS